MSFGMFFVVLQSTPNNDKNKFNNIDINNLKTSEISAKIHIDNNWTAAKSAGICTGNGTFSQPYLIENLVIDGGSTGSCIWIENTDAYFEIKNCTLRNSGDIDDAGIKLSDATNAKLIENNITSNHNGIYLINSEYSIITGNDVKNNKIGIFFLYSDANIITNNNITNNLEWGIKLYDDCDNNEISDNIINFNNRSGILLAEFCYFNNISINAVNNNLEMGILLNQSDYNDISANIVYNNLEDGVYLIQSYNNKILENNITYNEKGINMREGDDNSIFNNSIISNMNGIYLFNANQTEIIGNIADSNNYSGIYLSSCLNCEIYGNTLNNSNYGVYINDSFDNTLYLNNFLNNNQHLYSVISSNIWNSSDQMVYIYNHNEYINFLGNFWDIYTGNDANNDGIGDTLFTIAGVNDKYPLIDLIENYEIIRIYEPPSSPEIIPGYNITIFIGIISIITIFNVKKQRCHNSRNNP